MQRKQAAPPGPSRKHVVLEFDRGDRFGPAGVDTLRQAMHGLGREAGAQAEQAGIRAIQGVFGVRAIRGRGRNSGSGNSGSE